MKLAISGASGKTGYRIAEEAFASGYEVKVLVRQDSIVPESLIKSEKNILSLWNQSKLDEALMGCDVLVIATGARPSIDLTGPAKVDAFGVRNQVASCQRVGIKRVILVSSLCAGRWFHPLNLFGLILIWKRIGEQALQNSALDWTVIRPGGLTEQEDNLEKEHIRYSGPDRQQDAYIPRRLVAKSCIEAINTPSSIRKIIEITSGEEHPEIKMSEAIKGFA